MRSISLWILVVAGCAVSAGCAARQQTKAPTAPSAWNADQIGEVRGRCIASSTDRGIEVRAAKAMCSCLVPQFTQRFSYEWLDDGHDMTPDEVEAIGDMQDRCARQLADSGVAQSASEETGTGSMGR